MRYTEYMPKKQDISYGAIPIYTEADGSYRVLVIHQRSWTGEQFWIFPKGHPEGEESPVAAAARELQEETGITAVTIEPRPSFSMRYIFTHDGDTIKKTVTYFLGYVTSLETNITQPDEVVALEWCTPERALALLSHENSKNILQQVLDYIEVTVS